MSCQAELVEAGMIDFGLYFSINKVILYFYLSGINKKAIHIFPIIFIHPSYLPFIKTVKMFFFNNIILRNQYQ
jgi:hypothetical protein